MSGLGYDRGAAEISANVAPARTWTASIGLAQTSPSHWLRVSGLLVMLMIVGAAWTPTEARSPRKEPPKRPIHGPNYRPPYAANPGFAVTVGCINQKRPTKKPRYAATTSPTAAAKG